MGLAEEFDEEEGPLEEHIKRLTDSEKQVEVLKAALEAEKKKSACGDFCQIENCNRPVDLWCDACETPLCYRCSTKIVCEAAEKHNLVEFDVIYKDVKREFDKWRNNREETFLLLEFRQKKMMKNLRGKERELSEASGESLSERADRLSEIADLIRKLDPLSLQVDALKNNLTTYGDDVGKLRKPEYICVVKSVIGALKLHKEEMKVDDISTLKEESDRTNGAASVSSYTPGVKYPSQPSITKTPATPLITKSPARPTVTKTPDQPRSLQLIFKYDTDSGCYSVHHHSITGDILVGCYKGVKIISRQSGEITHLADYPDAVIKEQKGEVFISSQDNKTVNIYRFNMNNKTDELLFSFSHCFPYMSVSDHHIVCKDAIDMKLYNRASGTVSTVQLPGLSGGVISLQFLPDETLLVTGFRGTNKYRLNKYRLSDEGEPTLIWSCDDVDRARSVSVADNGLIIGCGFTNKTIHIVSSDGKKIRDMIRDELPKYCWDISIRGDELAVAGSQEFLAGGVLVLYKII